MKYACLGNMHAETGEPITLPFRWATFPIANIPICVGLAVLPPTPINQFIAQSVNQTYNFGINVSNASASNQLSTTELSSSYVAAISSAILGSVGLRKGLEKAKLPGLFGKFMLGCTPFLGVALASSVNLFFSRYKEVKEGISVINPKTGENFVGVKSTAAGMFSFKDSLLLRWLIPVPSILSVLPLVFLFPGMMSNLAKKQFKWYARKGPALMYDATNAYIAIAFATIFAMACIEPMGKLKKKDFEPEFQKVLEGFEDDEVIQFYKGQ